jgi:hypothetical protein
MSVIVNQSKNKFQNKKKLPVVAVFKTLSTLLFYDKFGL